MITRDPLRVPCLSPKYWATLGDVPAAVVHYELEFIHPFGDGNGRMGRLWHTP